MKARFSQGKSMMKAEQKKEYSTSDRRCMDRDITLTFLNLPHFAYLSISSEPKGFSFPSP